MTRPRKQLISLSDTPYYHITTRCVRRAFLCGEDQATGQSYEHRKEWIVDRVRLLSSLFGIDICAYAVMSNHYHLVLKLCPEQIEPLSDNDILKRWCSLFKGPLLIQRFMHSEKLSQAEKETVGDIIQTYRHKLCDIYWFMRCLNQTIAFRANREDRCTGRFWEARFHSQALKTEEALLSCMAYVELNPIRAKVANTPETSEHTSIKERIKPTFDVEGAIKNQIASGELRYFEHKLKPLLHFDAAITLEKQQGIPFTFDAFLELVDWTGRIIREDKRGAIPMHLPPILERFQITPKMWLSNSTKFRAIHRYRFNRQASTL